MPLFFILSGYFFEKSLNRHGVISMFVIKLKTIIYPFILWSLIQTSVEVFFSSFTNKSLDSSEILLSLIYPRSVFWFLFALFFINTLNLLLKVLFKDHYLWVSFIIYLIFSIGLYDLGVFNKTFSNIVYFNVGILLCRSRNYIDRFDFNIYVLISTIILFFLSQFLLQINFDFIFIVDVISALLGASLVIQISIFLDRKMSENWLKEVGQKSMGIFLTHLLFTVGIRIFLFKILHIDNVFLHVLLGSIGGIFLSVLFYNITTKYKMTLWLFKFPLKK